MTVNKETANKIWKAYFGNKAQANDPFGRTMTKGGHGTDWDVDHIWPLHEANGTKGSNTYGNVQPLAIKSNLEKSNNLNGIINHIEYAVVKVKQDHGIRTGRMSVRIDGEWYWGYDEPEYD